ncbi:Poly(A) RNA polymerase cid13 [Colletotrichum sp. SAR 10_98]|nr:Poly(A) RNA polymerase cid13 [Colletotrichum sp. SAR 10_98]
MPYSLGSDKLEKTNLEKIKSKLSEDEERKLITDMRELYDRLIPTEKVEENRKKLVVKLEKIFNEEWPGNDIRVNLFGSSGNLLCSDDSDVDICITTPWKEMEGVCMIANLLAKKGMEKVVCISAAKVPIVKIWDPELGLACDMNVNNTLALENTRMVRTYVEIDPRVRPLAMIVKYWTRKRIVNDAAFGGTLSSYTWICLIIGFLQLRDPPVLPSLHQRQHQRLPKKGGPESAFADDLDKLRGFGDKNKSSLGDLLFQFFRFYAHEFDYEKNAISVRLGRKVSKQEKGWHIGLNNFLCVEEPFNTVRNLGNTADEYSFRGLHLELRRAFDLISEAKLDECCEQYIYPKEEPPTFQRPAQTSRPVMIRSSSQQHSGRGGGRGNYRGGRHSNNFHRNGNSNRRASSSVAYDTNTMYMPQVAVTPQELAWFTQQPSAHQLQYPALVSAAMAAQLQQENNLRIQLYSQSQVYQQVQAQMAAQMHAAQRMQSSNANSQQGSERSRTNSFDNPPLSAPIAAPEWYSMYGGVPFPATYYNQSGFTYPSSPATTTATPEYRRGLQRSSVTTESGTSTSGSSLRSQSQPASRSGPAGQQAQGYPGSSTPTNGSSHPPRQVNGVPIPSFIPDDADYDEAPQRPASNSPNSDDGAAYLGYYVSEASSPARSQEVSGFTTDQVDGQSSFRSEPVKTPISERPPVIVNGTTTPSSISNTAATASPASAPRPVDDPSFRDRIALMNQYGWSQQAQASPEVPVGNQISLQRRAMRQQSGVIAPLDLATRENRMNGHQLSIDAQHLSPINETRSPSPTVVRKGDFQVKSDLQSGHAESTLPAHKDKGQVVKEAKQSQSTQSPKSQSSNAQRQSGQPARTNGNRENGHRGGKNDGHGHDGGWQKATKGRKKGDGKNQGNGFVSSELPPKHDADRKGG